MDTPERQARREANAGQPTLDHILCALNLLADYCEQHGYGVVVVGPGWAPTFLIDHSAEDAARHEATSALRDGIIADLRAQETTLLGLLERPRIPRLEPDDYAGVARLSE